MRKLYLSVFAMLSLFLFGCSINNNSNDEVLVDEIEDSVLNNASGSFDIVSFSREILSLMDSGFFDEISNFVHPIKWVRFSPYTYIDLDHSMVLYPDDFQGDLNSGTLLWGYTDWAGFELIETKYDYFKKWVYSTGFLYADQIFINQKISRWNNLNNIDEVFSGAQSIEYYFDWFDSQYEWIDWQSLTLVFEEYNGYYYLVWVIHGSWTI